MKLQKFIKNKKQKGIVIGSIVGILLLIGGITLYKTFAMYKVEKTFDVLNGTVPPFMNGDIQLAVTVDGEKKETIPTKDKNYGVVVSCDNATGSWDKDQWRAILEDFNGSKVKCNLYFESTLSGYIKALAKVEESIIEEEHEATDQTPELTDYRYVGANPNNYVCLEDDNKTCTDDNLYRIIGVIPTQKEADANSEYEDRVKLIKNTSYVENYTWGNDGEPLNGEWSKMKLNTETLNTTYWNSIQSYQQYIEKAKWYLGQNQTSYANAITFYRNERGNKMQGADYPTSAVENVGLFNVIDYLFATAGDSTLSRNKCLEKTAADYGNSEYASCKNNNWLFDSLKRYWTINLGSNNQTYYNAMTTMSNGAVVNANILTTNPKIYIKPSFYLKANVLYKNGDGTHENPYRISINEN